MTHMTPEQAQQSLARYRPRQLTPGGHYDNNTGYRALTALSADTLEYGVADANGDEDIVWFPVDANAGTAEDARLAAVNYANSDQFFRLVARRVSTPWEVADE